MKLSVVIPAYNEEKYLPKTLESINKLTTKPDEVIVIDGGSTDKTVEIARRFGATPITIAHRGIGYARQKGLEKASGDIIAFTDADTIVRPSWLTKIVETLKHPGVVGVYSWYYVPDGWLPYRILVNIFQPVYMILLHWLGQPVAPGQNSAFWKKAAIQAGGYPVDYKLAEDLEMMRRLGHIGRIVYRPDNFVISSGRRGNEGLGYFTRMAKALWYYYTQRKADTIGFPDIR